MRRPAAGRIPLRLLPALLALGCAGPGIAPAGGRCSVSPVSSAEVRVDAALRFRMRFAAGGRALSLESVVERSGEELVVVAIAPFGMRLFALRQRGREIEVLDAAQGDLVRIAEWVMDALHRAYWIEPPSSAVGPQGGSWEREGERITERRRDGRVVWREFASLASRAADAAVTLDYAPATSSPVGCGVEVRNPRCGYEAVIVALECAPADASARN